MDRIGAYSSLTRAIQQNGEQATYPSYETKQDRKKNVTRVPVECRAQDLTKSDSWGKFCEDKGYVNASLIHLTQAEAIRDELVPWLREFSGRYANLDGEGQLWLSKRALDGVVWRILENKWLGWRGTEDKDNPTEDYWSDDDLRMLYGFCYLVRKEQIPLIGKSVKKMMKDEEAELSDQAIDAIATQVVDLLFLAGIRSEVRVKEDAWQNKRQGREARENVG